MSLRRFKRLQDKSVIRVSFWNQPTVSKACLVLFHFALNGGLLITFPARETLFNPAIAPTFCQKLAS